MNKKNNCLLLSVLMGICVFWGSGVEGAVIGVTTTTDSVPGSLRAAITEANTNGEVDTIILPAGIYLLTGAAGEDGNMSGDLDFNSLHKISLVGAGIGLTIIDGNHLDRVVHIYSGQVSITGVTIRNGRTVDGVAQNEPGESGGGIYNAGSLTLKDCSLEGNTCGHGVEGYARPGDLYCSGSGGHGGGIYNTGILNLSGCRIMGNAAGRSGGAVNGCTDSPRGGSGGGIYNAITGTQVLDNCIITDNSSGAGYSGTGSDWDYCNGGGDGGGIYSAGTQTLQACTIRYNQTGKPSYINNTDLPAALRGNGGGIFNGGTGTISHCTIKSNFTGEAGLTLDVSGAGGGIYNRATLKLENCTVMENHTGKGGGAGGGIYHETGTLTITKSTIYENYTGDGSTNGFGQNSGPGGGMFNAGSLTMTNCTLSQNRTGNGGDSHGVNGGNGGSGGGMYSTGDVLLTHCTVAGNYTGSGGTKGNNDGALDGQDGYGGGLFISDTNGSLQIENTILANNQVATAGEGPDCYGPLYSKGYNLIENTEDCLISGTSRGNIMGQDPQLGQLADNGGPTYTHALLNGSPAIDSGYAATFSTDQRGYTRPVDIPGLTNANDGADIGAYEQGLAPTLPPRISLNHTRLVFGCDLQGHQTGPQQISLTNSGGGTLNWSASTDADWLHCSPATGSGAATLTVSVTPSLTTGTWTATLTIQDPNAENSPQQVDVIVYIYGTSDNPIGELDSPHSGVTVSGSVPVTGWAVDMIGITSIKLYREPVNGEGQSLIYIGDCMRVEGARPDVALLYPDYPNNTKAGWGYMLLTHFLPNGGNGTYILHVMATDVEGHQVTIGQTIITGDNAHAVKPFGTIDTPVQGGTVSGSQYLNFGWALTPLPNMIPLNGSTITVWVDGVALGHPVYNQPRQDIITLFPGYYNSQGAIGYYYLDTHTLANGIHTIAWSVMDNAGNHDGIGSRYFSVENSATENSTSKSYARSTNQFLRDNEKNNHKNDEMIAPDTVQVKTGYSLKTKAKTLFPDETGQFHLTIQELERLEIHLPVYADMEPGTLQLVGAPIGSYLDTVFHVWYWQPGVGFLGEHRLVFTYRSLMGDIEEKEIIVDITKKI